MRELAAGIWVVERPLRFAGLSLGARMTVVRLLDGSLFIHSPVALDDALHDRLLALGTPRYVVAPNRFHHLYVGDYQRAFSDLRLFAAPGLADKRRDLSFDAQLCDEAPAEWADELGQAFVGGMPKVNEVAFCHRASGTLVLCDLAFNIGREAPAATRMAFRLGGAYGRLAPTVTERLLVRDRDAARASLEGILAWRFDRVIVAHGRVLESGGREALRDGYRWLLQR